MHSRMGIFVLVGLVALAWSSCMGQVTNPTSEEARLRKEWDSYLKDGYRDGDPRCNYDEIFTVSPRTGMITGFRTWQGEYRGIPIALYSCGYSKPWGGELGWISIILAVEETGSPLPSVHPTYTGPPLPRAIVRQVAERRYGPSEITVESILSDPRHANTWSIGQVRAEVKDEGAGALGFRMNAAKAQEWEAFALETILEKEPLAGPKIITPLKYPEYTLAEFAGAMARSIAAFRDTNGRLPYSREMAAIEHPLWENPDAVKQLLVTAQEKELVYAINFMSRRSGRDSRYLLRLESIDQTLLGLADSKSPAVRGAFNFLSSTTLLWPRDAHVLEPLLNNADPEIQGGVLATFALRREIPNNLQRVRELLNSPDSHVRFQAERLMRVTGAN